MMAAAGRAAETIGQELRRSALTAATLRSASLALLPTMLETAWANQMAMAPTTMMPAAERASRWSSNVSPPMATSVAMVP